MLDQFDRLKKRNAFLEQYKKERIFENGLEEFDDARYGSCRAPHLTMIYVAIRATADELLKEYKACESPDYISYVRPRPIPSLHSVTGMVRGPTTVNKPDNTSIFDVLKTPLVYVLTDIPAKCIKLLFVEGLHRIMGNDEIKSYAVYDPTTQTL